MVFSTADWDTAYWTNKQHVAAKLAEMGHRVLYVETPGLRAPSANRKDLARLWRRLRAGLRRPAEVRHRVWKLSPLGVPFAHSRPLVRRLNQGLLRWRIASFMRHLEFERPIVWTYHPYMLQTLAGMRRGKLVYHCVDDLAAIPGVDAESFNREEERLLRQADVVFTTSSVLAEKCRRVSRHVHELPNVADFEHFARAHEGGSPPADMAAIPGPRIVYMGVLSAYKVDFALLAEAAALRPQWSWVLIGDEREGQDSPLLKRLLALGNVHALGYRSYAQLPEYLKGADVGLIPALVNEYTRSMFPMKYFEYLAAGVPVVATALEFTRDRPDCVVAHDAKELVALAERCLAAGRLSKERSSELVGENTWEARTRSMLALLEFA